MRRAHLFGAGLVFALPFWAATANAQGAGDALSGAVTSPVAVDAAKPRPKPRPQPAAKPAQPAQAAAKPQAGPQPNAPAKPAAATQAAKPAPAAVPVAAKAGNAPASALAPKAPAAAPAAAVAAQPPPAAKVAAEAAASGAATTGAVPAKPASVAAPAQVAPVAPTATPGGDAETQLAAGIKPGSKEDKRPAKKIFGAAKAPAALSARAIGGYAKGCLAGGAPLAIDGPGWQAMRLSRNRNWGHPKLIALLERFTREMQEKEKWPGLLIGDLAQPRGGPMLSGHKSHQLGLDADIWFRPMPANRMTKAERETAEPLLLARDNGSEVIAENWNEGFVRLVRRAAKYPEVERIFVHPAIKKAFCNAAGDDRAWLRKVRPMWLHNYHFHVRMSCPGDSPTCVAQKAIEAEGDGCGKELDDWIKLVSKPAKPAAPTPKPVEPVKPSKPSPPMMLKDLPPECAIVATAADAKLPPAPPPAVAAQPAAKAAQSQ